MESVHLLETCEKANNVKNLRTKYAWCLFGWRILPYFLYIFALTWCMGTNFSVLMVVDGMIETTHGEWHLYDFGQTMASQFSSISNVQDERGMWTVRKFIFVTFCSGWKAI